MAPLPSNNTGVVFLDYSVAGESHTVQIRYADPSTAVDAMDTLDDILAAAAASFRQITIEGARHRAEGSNVTLPLTWTGAATYGSGGGSRFETAYYMDFIGRSPDGRRVRLSLFGLAVPADTIGEDFRLSTSDSGVVANVVTVLNTATTTAVAIDGGEPVWYDYANIGTNAYWRNRFR